MSFPSDESYAKAKQMLAAAKKRVIRTDDTLRIMIGEDDAKVESTIKAALGRGETVTEGGVTRWIECLPLYDTSKTGTARYTWHRDGNRVKCERMLFTKTGGSVTKERLGLVWRDFMAVGA